MRLILAALAALALPSLASAQDLGLGAHAMPTSGVRITPRWDNYLFTGNHTDDLALGTADTGGTLWASTFSATADFRDFVLGLSVPVAFSHIWFSTNGGIVGGTTSTYDDQAELGNIELEGLANIDLGPQHRLLVGGGLALPTATDPLNPGGTRGFFTRQAAFHTTFRNPAAWADQAFTLWPTASYRFATDWLLVNASASLPIFFPTHGDYGGAVLGNIATFAPGDATIARGNVELMLTFEAGAALRLGNLVDVGASFLAWALPSAAGVDGHPDLGQTALALAIRTDDELDFPLGAGFEWILDLDNAWGPTGGDRRFWGAHAYVYGRIDVGSGGQVSTPDFDPDNVEPVHVGPTGGGDATTDASSTTGTSP